MTAVLGPSVPARCPSCQLEIIWDHKDIGVQIICPRCQGGMRLRHSYHRTVKLLSFAIVGLLVYALGARGDTLLWATPLLAMPVMMLAVSASTRLFAPEAEATGEFRGILYGEAAPPNDH